MCAKYLVVQSVILTPALSESTPKLSTVNKELNGYVLTQLLKDEPLFFWGGGGEGKKIFLEG